MQEASLLDQIKEGNQAAFKAIYEKYSGKVYFVCIRFGLDKNDAEEVVQDSFIKIWERRRDIRTDLSFNAYLFTIAKNFIIKRMRSNINAAAIKTYLAARPAELNNETEDLIVYADLLQATDAFIESLPTQQREIFKLSKLQRYSAKEISEKLELSTRTVENHLFRANTKLKSRLKALGIHLNMFTSLMTLFL